MPNFLKIFYQIEKFPIQGRDSNLSVCVVAICDCDPNSMVSTNEQVLGKKMTCAKFQFDISKSEPNRNTITSFYQLEYHIETISLIF